MKWNVGNKIAAAFGAVVVIFVLVGWVSYRGTNELIEASDLRKQNHIFLRHIDRLQGGMLAAEAAQRSYLLTRDEAYPKALDASVRETEEALSAIRMLAAGNARLTAHVDALEPAVKRRLASARESLQGPVPPSGFDAARLRPGMEVVDEARRISGKIEQDEEATLGERIKAADDSAAVARRTIVAGTLTGLIAAIACAVALARNIAGPLQELTAIARRMALGDIATGIVAYQRADEVGELTRAFATMEQSLRTLAVAAERIAAGDLRTATAARSPQDVLGNAFARMVENLREQIRAVAETTAVLGSASSQIVASTSQLAASASESAAAVTETTTTVEEVRQTAHLASQKAAYVSDSAQRAASVSQRGRKSAEDVVEGIERIRRQMQGIASSMMRLSEQSHAIGQIIASVEDLAAQSNLLAVNAAMEAAKAGEAGKGFAVVAQEVKSLAEQSRQATNQVRTILADIQKATTAAVLATEEGGKAVEAGAGQTSVAGDSIRALAESVSEAAQAATQIAASSQQQLVGVDQVAGAMANILDASNQNVESAKQLEVAARDLNDLGLRLKKTIERYVV